MNLSKKTGATISGTAAGATNGLFGAGGGMVLIPLLSALAGITGTDLFPNSVAVILPISLVTLSVTANQMVSVTYGGITYTIHLRSFREVMYADVSVNGEVVSLGVRCLPGVWLMPNLPVNTLDAGNMRFVVDGGAYPYYTDFGTTCRLMFFTKGEIEKMADAER